MIHTDMTLLVPALQNRSFDALDAMRADEQLRAMRVDAIEVVETLRDVATQMAYYSRGRMAIQDVQAMYKTAGLYAISSVDATKPVTWTLDSKHIHGEAIDLAPVRDGRIWWAAPHEVWGRMGVLGEAHGLKWGGRWKHKDTPHFEI